MSRYSGKKTSLGIGFVLVFLIIVHYVGWLRPVETFFRSLIAPSLSQVTAVSVNLKGTTEFFKSRQAFLDSYAQCRSQLAEENVSAAKIKMLSDENEELRKQLNFKNKEQISLVTANVVGKEANNSEQIIIINRGQRDGLVVGQPVVAGSGILVGKVIKVDPDSAAVLLINDNQSKIAAIVLNNDHSSGVVEGGFGISLTMKLIPRNETVVVGDVVVTSGLENQIPRGLLIGSVTVVENEAYQPFQQAILTPAVDLTKLTVVSVVTTATP